jgi:hypothetical protein
MPNGRLARNRRLVGRRLVVAGLAARFAIHEAVAANANVNHCLAKATEFLAFAGAFRVLALGAAVFCGTASGTHAANVAPGYGGENVTEVTDQGVHLPLTDS